MSENKNVPSKNPLLIRRKKVAKELEELIRAEGLAGSLFEVVTPARTDKDQRKWERRATRIVEQALEFEMQVPKALLARLKIQTEFEPNPTVHVEDDGKAPF
ncbi:MAG: hypothetical protein ACK5IP_08710 [Paracoccus sp. (in: a-proteobacteria)]